MTQASSAATERKPRRRGALFNPLHGAVGVTTFFVVSGYLITMVRLGRRLASTSRKERTLPADVETSSGS